MSELTIGKLAKEASVGVETVRFYERKGLIKKPSSKDGYRKYPKEDILRISFIKRAQDLGFTLSEIKDLLELNTRPNTTCAKVKEKTLLKLQEIDEKIKDLERMKASLTKLSNACDATKDQYKSYKVQECFDIGLNCKC
jgi:MerR family mercuric resistance operon transcriptional regulator